MKKVMLLFVLIIGGLIAKSQLDTFQLVPGLYYVKGGVKIKVISEIPKATAMIKDKFKADFTVRDTVPHFGGPVGTHRGSGVYGAGVDIIYLLPKREDDLRRMFK